MALAERDGHDLVDLLADALDLIERRAGRDAVLEDIVQNLPARRATRTRRFRR